MAKGGVYGSLKLYNFEGGNSKRYKKPAAGATDEVKAAASKETNKSPLVKLKGEIGKFFGWTALTEAEKRAHLTRHRKVTINGVSGTQEILVNAGSTGKSRSVKVMFTGQQSIGGKRVASVNIPMPASYTFADMVDKIMSSPKKGVVARIISPRGRSLTYNTPYNPRGRSTTPAAQ